MAESIGWSTLDVIPNMRDFRRKLESGTKGDFEAIGKSGGRRLGDVAGKEAGKSFKTGFGSFTKNAFGSGLAILGGISFAGIFKDAIDGASDLQESGSKVAQIFGDAQGAVQDFAAQGAKALGQTRLQVLTAASTFGTFGKAAGLSGSELSDFSTKLVSLSTDMASFHNSTPEEAVEALGAALRGESEPIRRFGVLLDDMTLRQEAVRLGLIKTTKDALTPQQKTLASYNVILRQTADAQGDFEKTSGGLANQQRILAAQWGEMKTELGQKLLPVVTSFVSTLNTSVIPALGSVGGAAEDAVKGFVGLPEPVKAAALAFVALRLAMAAGLTGALATGATRSLGAMRSGMDALRLRTMLATDQFRSMRTTTLTFVNGAPQFTRSVGRMQASLGALRTAAAGAGAGLRRGLGGMSSLVGGPWGAAFLAGVAVLAKFKGEQAEAKARVDALTESLDKQTGALTKQSESELFSILKDKGAIEGARQLGIELDTMRLAASGNADALARVRDILGDKGNGFNEVTRLFGDDQAAAAYKVEAGLIATGNALRDSNQGWKDAAEFSGEAGDAAKNAGQKSADATRDAAAKIKDYQGKVKSAQDAVRALMDAEDDRRNSRLKDRRDAVGLAQALADTRTELAEGTRTLDINTQAGRDNMNALLDLAAQWNESSDVVQGRKGAWKTMRDEFISIADQMGFTQAEARKMADQILEIPDKSKTQIDTPGLAKALRQLAELEAQLWTLRNFGAVGVVVGASVARVTPQPAPAPTSSGGGNGGHVNQEGAPRRAAPVVQIENQTVVAHDYNDFLVQQQRRAELAAIGGIS